MAKNIVVTFYEDPLRIFPCCFLRFAVQYMKNGAGEGQLFSAGRGTLTLLDPQGEAGLAAAAAATGGGVEGQASFPGASRHVAEGVAEGEVGWEQPRPLNSLIRC